MTTNPKEEVHRLIENHTLFSGVPGNVLGPLVEGREIRSLSPGEILLEPGQENTNLYLLLDGQLRVHIDRIDSEDSFFIKPDQCAGEISVVDNKPPSAFVVVDKPSQVLVFPEEEIWEGLIQVPQIAKNFMQMFADRTRANNDAIQEALDKKHEYDYLQKELRVAYEFQMSMLPTQLNLGSSAEIATGTQPAQEVGGDFYDAFPVSSDEYAVVIGDIAGTGVPAALFMVRTMTLLRSDLLRGETISTALHNLNVTLCRENPNKMFASVVIGLLNPHTGQFDYVSAGHDPLILGRNGADYETLAPPKGILVGIDENSEYEVASVELGPDDVLFFHTDGISEAKNPAGENFGLGRVKQQLNESSGKSAGQLADGINRAVHEFVADATQTDDKTMMILRFLGPTP